MKNMASISNPPLLTAKTADVQEYAAQAWNGEDWLFSALKDPQKSLNSQGEDWRLQLKFYLGHPAAFYINKLVRACLLKKGVDPEIERRFAAGVDVEDPVELVAAGRTFTDIGVKRLTEYRTHVRETVSEVIERSHLGDNPVSFTDQRWALFMGIEHQLIHIETSAALLRGLPTDALQLPDGWQYGFDSAANKTPLLPNSMVPIPGQEVRMGVSDAYPYYRWDNEFGEKIEQVPEFEAAPCMVSNEDFGAFVEDGGYTRKDLWTPMGNRWKTRFNVTHPRYWIAREDGQFGYRAQFSECDTLPKNLPAEINHFEAEAYMRWMNNGCRMPTEAEYRALLAHSETPNLTNTDPALNLNLKNGSPVSVQQENPHHGIHHARGNVWHLINDQFEVFPGFKPHAYYPDFSPRNDPNQRTVLGGSYLTAGTQALPAYRLWMYPPFGHQQPCGLRVVKSR